VSRARGLRSPPRERSVRAAFASTNIVVAASALTLRDGGCLRLLVPAGAAEAALLAVSEGSRRGAVVELTAQELLELAARLAEAASFLSGCGSADA
jgi:hypothetical protein